MPTNAPDFIDATRHRQSLRPSRAEGEEAIEGKPDPKELYTIGETWAKQGFLYVEPDGIRVHIMGIKDGEPIFIHLPKLGRDDTNALRQPVAS